ncbi:SDR family oxidoreductase [Paucibacter sp. B2R-40]|uniref:SDR family oxidoreductase n=1 Tax=Paucibacter sp. B2R-40 TaxID=2893554 RepID=UPI0021E45E4C|nr:SDR family oxidoreductase [Paucibacter sp. B2R-40]MCV2352539.1 SDR family oxidoreductase [Paucibacter sp. B2R-40]
MSTILVIGASGTVGSELSSLLTQAGHTVRKATSRTPTAPDQVHLNLLTGEGRDAAFAGVDQAFFLAPPGHTRQDLLLNPLVDAARAEGVQKVVLMSAMGANADEAAPLRLAERHLEASGLAFNVIRPNWFMQNFNTFWLHGILNQGQILLPTGEAKGSFIDARDIAAVAAELLVSDRFNGQDFDLTGPEALDHHQVAALLTQASGKRIGYTDISPEAMREGLLGAGLPADYADFMLVILGYFKAGYSERTTDAVHTITGHAPRSVAQYARDYKTAWA